MSITTIDQFPFEFYGATFTACLASNRKVYIPMKALCDAMGLQTHGQVRRLRDQEAVADSLIDLKIVWSYGDQKARDREMVCLDLEQVPFWMGTIQTSRISDTEKRQQIVKFQREFAKVAWAAFRRELVPDDMLAELESNLSQDEQAYLSIMDEGSELRQQISLNSTRLENQQSEIDELTEEIKLIKAQIVGTDFLNPQQMKQYTDMVAIVARLLKRRQKGNEATVHAEIKRQFQVPSYQLIPESEFEQVKSYLRQWFVRLAGVGSAVPQIFDTPSQTRLL